MPFNVKSVYDKVNDSERKTETKKIFNVKSLYSTDESAEYNASRRRATNKDTREQTDVERSYSEGAKSNQSAKPSIISDKNKLPNGADNAMREMENINASHSEMGAVRKEDVTPYEVYKKYNIDPDNFTLDDLDKWAKSHNFEVRQNGEGFYYAPKYNGGFLGFGGKKKTTDEEDKEFEILKAVADNNARRKNANIDMGKFGAAMVGVGDGLSFGMMSGAIKLGDKVRKNNYKKLGLDEDTYAPMADTYKKTVESHPIANAVGNIAGGIIPIQAVSGVVSSAVKNVPWVAKSAPWVQRAISDGITFGVINGTRTAFQGGTAEDVILNAARGAVSSAAGGALSTKAEQAITSLLTNPRYMNSFLGKIKDLRATDYVKNTIVGLTDATGDAAGDAIFSLATGGDMRKPIDIATDFVVTTLFGIFQTAANSKSTSKQNRENLEILTNQYVEEYNALNQAARRAETPEGFAEIGEEIIRKGNNLKSFLRTHIFTGQSNEVKQAVEIIEHTNNRVRERINEVAGDTYNRPKQSNPINNNLSKNKTVPYSEIPTQNTLTDNVNAPNNPIKSNTSAELNEIANSEPIKMFAPKTANSDIKRLENILIAQGSDDASRQEIVATAVEVEKTLAGTGKTIRGVFDDTAKITSGAVLEIKNKTGASGAFWKLFGENFKAIPSGNVTNNIELIKEYTTAYTQALKNSNPQKYNSVMLSADGTDLAAELPQTIMQNIIPANVQNAGEYQLAAAHIKNIISDVGIRIGSERAKIYGANAETATPIVENAKGTFAEEASSTPSKNVRITQVGDFYEAYGNDAVELARKLNLTPTTKTINGVKMQMVGFPVSSLDRYKNILGSNYNISVSDTPGVTSINEQNMPISNENTPVNEDVTNIDVDMADGEILSLKHTKNVYSLFKGAVRVIVGKDVISDGFVAIPLTDEALTEVKKVAGDVIQDNPNFELSKIYHKDNDVLIHGNPKTDEISAKKKVEKAYVFKIGNAFYTCQQKYIDAFNNGKNVITANKRVSVPWTVHNENGEFVALFSGADHAMNDERFNSLQYVSKIKTAEQQKKADNAAKPFNQNEIRLLFKEARPYFFNANGSTYVGNNSLYATCDADAVEFLKTEYRSRNTNSNYEIEFSDSFGSRVEKLLSDAVTIAEASKPISHNLGDKDVSAYIVGDYAIAFDKNYANFVKKRSATMKIVSEGNLATTLLVGYDEDGNITAFALPILAQGEVAAKNGAKYPFATANNIKKLVKDAKDSVSKAPETVTETPESVKNTADTVSDETIEIETKLFNNIVDEVENDDTVSGKKGKHYYVSKHTPEIIVKKADIEDLPMIISFETLYLAVRENGELKGHYHGLGASNTKKLYKVLSDPTYILKNNENGRINIISDIAIGKNNKSVISIELDVYKNVEGVKNTKHKGNYNLVITLFSAKDNYAENLKNKQEMSVLYEKKEDTHSSDLTSENMMLGNTENVSSVDNSVSQNNDVVNNSVRNNTENDTAKSYDVAFFEKMCSDIRKGESISLKDMRTAIDALLLNHGETIKSELSQLKNDELKKRISVYDRGRITKKAEMVDSIYTDMLSSLYYAISGKDTITYIYDGTGFDAQQSKMLFDVSREMTEETFSKRLAENAEKYKKQVAAREEKLSKVKNPQTLEDYAYKKRHFGLSEEETIQYENLYAKERRKAREEKKTAKTTKDTSGADAFFANADNYTIEKTTHTKTGEDVWVVRPANRLGLEEWKQLNEQMKSLGGLYWRGNQGWNFKKDPTATLTSTEETETAKRSTNAEKLRAVAESMQKAIDDKFRDRLTNTAKRAREAASAEAEGEKLKRLQDTINNIADALEDGENILLDKIDSKAQVETLMSMLRTGRRNRISENLPDITYAERLKEEDKPYSNNDVKYAEYPLTKLHENIVSNYLNAAEGKTGYKQITSRLKKALKTVKNGYVTVDAQMYSDINKIVQNLSTYRADFWNDGVAERKRLARMGIENAVELRAYLREFIKFLPGRNIEAEKQKAIKEKERQLANAKIEGFFPTPKAIVEKMLDEADIKDGEKVLEPSAGKGNIADAIRENYPNNALDVVEWNASLNGLLTEKGHNVVGNDFLKTSAKYDKIVMNPPFEKGQDIDHIRHAYSLLNDGGRVVCIMSEGPFYRSDKKAADFRKWLDAVGGISEKLPDGSFKTAERSTGVNTRLVVIDKTNTKNNSDESPRVLTSDELKELKEKQQRGEELTLFEHRSIQKTLYGNKTNDREITSLAYKSAQTRMKKDVDNFLGIKSSRDLAPSKKSEVANDTKSTKSKNVLLAIKKTIKPEITSNANLMSMLSDKFGSDGVEGLVSKIVSTFEKSGELGEFKSLFADGGLSVYNALKFDNAETADIEITQSDIESVEIPHISELNEVRYSLQNNSSTRFINQIDKWKSGKMQPNEQFEIGQTPEVLKGLGAKDLPVVMTQNVMAKITGGKHNVSIDEIKNIPQAIADPIMVFKSATVKNSYVILTELTDKSGNDVVVALHLNRSEKHINVNRIASVYGKESIENFVEKQAEIGNLLYIDKNKSQQWSQSRGLQLPKLADTIADNNNILQKDDIVNRYSANNSNKYSNEGEEINDEQAGNLLSDGNGGRPYSASAKRKTKRLDGRSSRYREGRTAARERREYCKTLEASGNTEQKVIYGHKCEVIPDKHYTPRMTKIAEQNKKDGIDETVFVTGKFTIPFVKDKNGNPKKSKGVYIKANGKKVVIVQYDNESYLPEQINDHEKIHDRYHTTLVKKAKNIIMNSLSVAEKKKVIDKLTRDYNGIIEDNEEEIIEEFVANVLSDMDYEYLGTFEELQRAYWNGDEKFIDNYKVSEYSESIDVGGTNADLIDNVGFGNDYRLTESFGDIKEVDNFEFYDDYGLLEGSDLNDGENTETLAEHGSGRSEDSIWQQSNDSEKIYKRLENDGKRPSTGLGKRSGFVDWGRKLQSNGATSSRTKERTYGILREISKRRIADVDAEGRKLSPRIKEYFSNTVFKDEKGELVPLYHSTDDEFNTFEHGDFGFHLGTAEQAIFIGKKYIKEVYVNIANPLYISKDRMRWPGLVVASEALSQGIITKKEYTTISKLDGFYGWDYNSTANKSLRNLLKRKGYDGIIYNNDFEGEGISAIAFDSNQIKYVSNKNPSASFDIRYALNTNDNDAEFWEEWLNKAKEYGIIPKGENPMRDIDVPQKITKDKLVSRFARTMLEAGITPDTAVSEFEKRILDGTMTHEVVTNDAARKWAVNQIKYHGFEEALNAWNVYTRDGNVGKKELALGMELYNQCITNGDVTNAMKIAAELVAESTHAGQTLQATRMLKLMTPDGQLYYLEKSIQKMNDEFKKKIGDKYEDIELNEELMEKFLTEKESDKRDEIYDNICQDIADQIPATMLDKWNSWRYLAMLGNPRTHIRNIAGNAVFTPAIKLKNYIGAIIEKTARIDLNKRTKSLHKSKRAVEFAKNDFAKMLKVLQGENAKYAVTSDIEGKRTIFKTKWLEKLRTKNFEWLEIEDMWFLKMHYVDALAQIITARKIDVDSIDEKTLNVARAYAVKEAQRATYRDANSLAEALNKLQKKASHSDKKAVRAANILIEGVMPFKKTPLNIAKQGVQYSPIGILSGVYKAVSKIKNGDAYSATDIIDDFAKGLTGTALMMLGAFLASLGIISGGDDENKKKKAFDKMVGEQSFSLNIGNGSYTIDWMTPLCLPLFTGVELYELTKDDFKLADIANALSSLTDPLLELSVFSGISGAIESAQYNDTNTLFAIGSDMTTSYLTQALPTIGGQLSRIIDKNKREYYYNDKNSNLPKDIQRFIGQAASKIPFASYLFEPSIDEWGREETYGGIVERTIENVVSPGYYSEKNYTAVDEEIKRLYESTGDTDVLPVIQQKKYTANYVDYPMTAAQYTKAKRLRGQKSFELIEQLLSDRMQVKLRNKQTGKNQTKIYSRMSDEEKARAIKKCYDQAGEETKKIMLDDVKNNKN